MSGLTLNQTAEKQAAERAGNGWETPSKEDRKPPTKPKLIFHDAWQGAFKPPQMRECIIEGLLRRGEVGNFIASTKAGKSWFALMLLISMATGQNWLGRRVARGNVLLIDNELHTETIDNRIYAVSFAMKIEKDDHRDRFEYLACRGEWISILDLIEGIPEKYPPGSLNMIVIDAKYRLFGDGLEENSNDDQTTFHNMIDKFAGVMNCPIVLVHHSTKGDQTGKAVTEMGSGGGSQSRTVDLHMVIRPHQEPGLAVLEATLRSFVPAKPMTLRWNWPLWTVADDIEPALPRNAKQAENVSAMRTKILKYLPAEWKSLSSLAERCGTKKTRNPFADIIEELTESGMIEISEDYVAPNSKRTTTGLRLTPDNMTPDNMTPDNMTSDNMTSDTVQG
jgi:RecA-family ATPase